MAKVIIYPYPISARLFGKCRNLKGSDRAVCVYVSRPPVDVLTVGHAAHVLIMGAATIARCDIERRAYRVSYLVEDFQEVIINPVVG